jgi:hypothetical protein
MGGQPQKKLQDLNKEIKKWIPNFVTTDQTNASCEYKDNYAIKATPNVAKLDAGSSEPQNHSYDYYACGAKDEGVDGQCIGLSDTVWSSIWDNCKDSPKKLSKGGDHNTDTCSNMPWAPGVVREGFNVGWRTYCNDSGKYLPEENRCSKDCGVDSKCTIPNGNFGGHVRPAYPINIPKLVAVSDGVGGTHPSLKTQKISDQYECPATHTREFSCSGDGFPNFNDDVPGCGQGKDIPGLEDPIKFCARATKDYDFRKLAGCCMDNQPGWGDGSGQNEHPSNRCPRGYCRSHLTYEGGDGNQSADNKCETPFTSGDKSGCYAMSDKCNTLFKDVCTQDVFTTVLSKDDRKSQSICKQWAKIMPGEFNDIAKDICSLPKPGGEGRFNINDAELLTKKMQGRGGINLQNKVISIFTSELCRNYILNNISDNAAILRKICVPAVKKEGDGWVTTDYGKKMGDICPCYLPTAYYEWFKDEKLRKGGKIESSITQSTKPWCFDMDCTATMLFPDNYASCPDIQTCINEIEQNVTVAGGGKGRMTRPSGREIATGTQSCNFNSINGSNAPATGITGGGAVGAIAAQAAIQASYNERPGQDESDSGYDSGYGMDRGSGGNLDSSTDKLISVLAILFCLVLVIGGILMAFRGGMNKKG